MRLSMTCLHKDYDSDVWQWGMRVPRHVLSHVKGRRIVLSFPPVERGHGPFQVTTTIGDVVKFSVRTKDERVAMARDAHARSEIQRIFDAAERGPTTLTFEQIVALSGDIYHLLVRTHSANPGPVSAWTAFKAFTRATVEGRFATPPVMTADSFVASDEWLAAEMFGEEISAIVDRHPPHQVTDALESRFGLLTDWVLARHKIEVDWSFGEIR